jgi:hypothetical protein
MMNDEEALEYYYRAIRSRPAHVAVQAEQDFFREYPLDINRLTDLYGHIAAIEAKRWYENNSWQKITLGRCVRAANTGLIHAAHLFQEKKHADTIRFKDYAPFFIKKELAAL